MLLNYPACVTVRVLCRAQELCESRQGGCRRLSIPNSPYGFCGRKATLNLNFEGCFILFLVTLLFSFVVRSRLS